MKSRKPILYMKQCSVLQSKCYLALAQRHGYDHKCLSILVATKSTQHSAQHTRIYWMHIRTMAAENASRSSSTMRNRYFWPLHFWPPPHTSLLIVRSFASLLHSMSFMLSLVVVCPAAVNAFDIDGCPSRRNIRFYIENHRVSHCDQFYARTFLQLSAIIKVQLEASTLHT